MKTPIKQHFFNNIAREFDTYVRQSIPLYGDFIDNLRANIISNHHGERVLDICGSTGLLGVDLFNEGFDGEYVNVDGSPRMIEIAESIRTSDKHHNCLKGFTASWVDEDGTFIEQMIPREYGRFDIMLELLGFQFFTQTRGAEIEEMKKNSIHRSMYVFCEKFKPESSDIWIENERLKNTLWKAKFFTPEQLQWKRDEVLKDMNEYIYPKNDFKALLSDYFTYSKEVYRAGNFAAYIASNDFDRVNDYIINEKLLQNDYNVK